MLNQTLRRLGVANCLIPNASGFAQTELMLVNAPVYQQQIAHSTAWIHGPGLASGEWCLQADNEWSNSNTIRQLSPHNTRFSRRNLTDTPRFAWEWHRTNTSNQIYYVVNEPDQQRAISGLGYCASVNCSVANPSDPPAPYRSDNWDPPDAVIDRLFNSYDPPYTVGLCWPNPNDFWEYLSGGQRIKPEALAYVFATLKRITENSPNRGHIVLPPMSTDPEMGAPGYTNSAYWASYFNRLHNPPGGYITVPGTGAPQYKLSVPEMRVLHIHSYANRPISTTPLDSVADQTSRIRTGVGWYRNTYNGGQPLPLDAFFSEMGQDWNLDVPIRWAGGWPNMRLGLSWWNSWLHWLLYVSPGADQLNLANGYTSYGCIHEATESPYAQHTGFAPPPSTPARPQQFVYYDLGIDGIYWYVPVVDTQLPADGRFQGTFSALDSVQFGTMECNGAPVYWRRTPFGACYTVWSTVCSDSVTNNLSTGWVVQSQAGTIGDAVVWVPQAGYNTIYIAVAKHAGSFFDNTRIEVRWIRDDGNEIAYAVPYMGMNEFQDSVVASPRVTYSAMVYPFVCYVSAPRNVRLRLSRNFSGPNLSISRPIALPGMCSWMTSQ